MLANIFKAKTLLGTATPSIESMYNVKVSKYGFIYLSKRYANYLPPIIERLIDIKDKQHRKRMNGAFFLMYSSKKLPVLYHKEGKFFYFKIEEAMHL